eukprot:1091500-Prymnesium_polylepis.1
MLKTSSVSYDWTTAHVAVSSKSKMSMPLPTKALRKRALCEMGDAHENLFCEKVTFRIRLDKERLPKAT